MSLRVRAEPGSDQKQYPFFSAAFELHGNANQGRLRFYTPLGSTAAAISWTTDAALLKTSDQTQQFGSLNQLINNLLGTDLPVTALFAWLHGQAQQESGWQVDLSQLGQGKILAQRLQPGPAARLQLLLDR